MHLLIGFSLVRYFKVFERGVFAMGQDRMAEGAVIGNMIPVVMLEIFVMTAKAAIIPLMTDKGGGAFYLNKFSVFITMNC